MSICSVVVFKQKTAYEMRISDWSSDVCSSDLVGGVAVHLIDRIDHGDPPATLARRHARKGEQPAHVIDRDHAARLALVVLAALERHEVGVAAGGNAAEYRVVRRHRQAVGRRSEEHTSELQSLMRISYAVFCLKKKTIKSNN